MQRLFSMFPAGAAGTALAVLRLSAAGALAYYGVQYASHEFRVWILLAFTLTASALVFGVLTPYASGIGCLLEIGIAFYIKSHSILPVVYAIANTACLAVLGPGAYSLDARLFGRRIVEFSDNKDSDRP